MTIGEYLRMVLTQDPGVAALVGDRVYSEVLPQAPRLPAVVFTQVSGEEDYALDGPTGVNAARFQLDAWARSRQEATILAHAARRCLANHAGAADGIEVQATQVFGESWRSESDTQLRRLTQEIDLWFATRTA